MEIVTSSVVELILLGLFAEPGEPDQPIAISYRANPFCSQYRKTSSRLQLPPQPEVAKFTIRSRELEEVSEIIPGGTGIKQEGDLQPDRRREIGKTDPWLGGEKRNARFGVLSGFCSSRCGGSREARRLMDFYHLLADGCRD